MDYSLRYKFDKENDNLIVNFSNLDITKSEKFNDLIVSYNNSIIVGYEFHHINAIVKIFQDGYIFLPPKPLIDVLNNILKVNHFRPLTYFENSSFYIGEVIAKSNNETTINIGGKNVTALNAFNNINKGDKVVYTSMKDYSLYTKSIVKGYEYIIVPASLMFKDMKDDEGIIANDNERNGSDFFRR